MTSAPAQSSLISEMDDRDREALTEKMRKLRGKMVEIVTRHGTTARGVLDDVDGRLIGVRVGVTFQRRGADGHPVGKATVAQGQAWYFVADVLSICEIPPPPEEPLVKPVTLMPPNGGLPTTGTG